MKHTSLHVADRSLSKLENELTRIPQQSLRAMRRGDFRAVVKHTDKAARVNPLTARKDLINRALSLIASTVPKRLCIVSL